MFQYIIEGKKKKGKEHDMSYQPENISTKKVQTGLIVSAKISYYILRFKVAVSLIKIS